MIYSVLIHEAPGIANALPAKDGAQLLEAHRSLQKDTKENGSFIAATQLSETGAVTVRHLPGETIVTDGPFAETRELFIGFYLFEADSLDAAIELAKRIPISGMGSVEVRPVVFSECIAHSSG